MPDRISQDDSVRDEQLKQSKSSEKSESNPELPKGYINPFHDKDELAGDGYPYAFSDVDFEMNRSPRYFKGQDKVKITEEELMSGSKSALNRIYQNKRWRTWKYLEEQPKATVVMVKGEDEPEFARGTVSINYVTYYIYKGVEVYVPTDVKDMILTSQKMTGAAGRKDLLTSLSQKLDPITGLPKDPSRLER